MKKVLKTLLSLILVVSSLFVITACNDKKGYADDAVSYIKSLYKNKGLETASDYDLVAKVDIQGHIFEIEWTITIKEGIQEDIKVVKSEDGNKYTVDVNEDATEDTTYTLTAKIKGTKKSVSFEHKLPKFKVSTFEEWLELCKTNSESTIIIKAYVIAIVGGGSSAEGSLYLQDADGYGYYAYKPTTSETFEFGDEVIVKGTGTVYSGQYEFEAGCTVEKTGEKVTELPYTDGTVDWTAAESQKDESLIKYQNALVKLTGCKMANVDGDYFYFTIGESEVKFNLYDSYYFLNEEERKTITDQWEAGTIFDIYGIVSCYSNLYQIYPIDTNALQNLSLPVISDEDAINVVKDSLNIEQTKFEEETEFEVPTKGYGDQVSISWSADNDQVTFDATTGKITIVLGEEDAEVTLTATLTAGTKSDTVEFKLTIFGEATDQYLPKFIDSAVEGTYVIAMNLTAYNGKYLYATGTLDSQGALETTEKAAQAANFVVEAVEGKEGVYSIKLGDEYLVAYRNGDYNNLKFDEAVGEWTWDAETKVFVADVTYDDDGTATTITVYFGSYLRTNNSVKNTMALSDVDYITGDDASKINVSQFPGFFATLVSADFYVDPIDSAVEGTYVIAMNLTAYNGKYLYATGTLDSQGALETTEKAAQAANFVVEAVEGKEGVYSIKLGDEYLVAYRNGDYNNLKFDEAVGEWTWDAETKVFVADVTYDDDGTAKTDAVYFGSYLRTNNSVKNTMALSDVDYITGDDASKINVSQFPGFFSTLNLKETEFKALDSAVEGTYIIAMNLTAYNGKYLYATGTLDSQGALETTDKLSKAANFVVEAVEGKEGVYSIKLGDEYLVAYRNGDYNNLKFDEAVGEWTWDAETKVFVADVTYDDDGTAKTDAVYFGSYLRTNNSVKNTMALSDVDYITGDDASKINVSQFPGFFGNVQFVSDELTEQELEALAEKEIKKVVSEGKAVNSDLAFFDETPDLKGVTFAFTSNNTEVIAADGTFIAPDVDTDVVIEVLVTFSDTHTRKFTYTVKVKVPGVATVIISQAYGGGGNSGATLKNDFIELYNTTDEDIDITGWTLFYASTSGSFSTSNKLELSGTIKAKSFYLIQAAAGNSGTEDLPTPDAICNISLSGTNFKLALCNSSDIPADSNATNIEDFVGAGTANDFETSVAPAPSNTKAIVRSNLIDTDDNGADFVTADPNPRNSAYVQE